VYLKTGKTPFLIMLFAPFLDAVWELSRSTYQDLLVSFEETKRGPKTKIKRGVFSVFKNSGKNDDA